MKYNYLLIVLVFAFAKAYTQEISPQTSIVDIQQIEASIEVDFPTESISGKVNVKFQMLEDAKEVYLDGKQMELLEKADEKGIKISATDDKIVIKGNFKKKELYNVSFSYKAAPKQAAYFVMQQDNMQFWTQGQGKYTSHWLPSIDDMNDKIEFKISVLNASDKEVVSLGQEKPTNTFHLRKPISSYLVGLVIGDYWLKQEISSSGVPLEFYYYPEDSLKVNPTYRHSKQVFDFLETEIRVPFPFSIYKQIPVKDFLYAGMENASCTIFSDNFVVDEIGFNDRNYVNVNAHELAHQWFGDLVTETKSDHHWLHEGFATYYALLAEREIFGDDYFYFKLFETAEQLRELSDQGKGQQLVAAGGSSLIYYQKGAWALHILREKVGEDAFAKAVESYLNTYAFKNVTTSDFMDEVRKFTEHNLLEFEKKWLYQSAFQAEEALQSLKKSDFMQQYFQLQSGRAVPITSKFNQLMEAVDSNNDYLGQEAIYQISEESIHAVIPIYSNAMASDNLFIRQAIATSLQEVPEPLVQDFYELLNDKSYLTQEQAFIKLWMYHQQRNDIKSQHRLLNLTASTFGFADGNIKTLWLALSLATPEYKPFESVTRFEQLIDYTAPKYPYQLRENAFRYLSQLRSFEQESLRNLIEASAHHVWRFREGSRKLLNQLIKDPNHLNSIKSMKSSLSQPEKDYLDKIGVN